MQRMGWSYAEMMATPERVVDDVLDVMEAESRDAEDQRRDRERDKHLGKHR